MKNTDVSQFLAELEGGSLEQKMATALSQVAAAAVDHDKAGKIVLTLNIKPVGNGNHLVTINHKLEYLRPTMRGAASEKETGATPMHVGTGGSMTFFPEKQGEFFGKPDKTQSK